MNRENASVDIPLLAGSSEAPLRATRAQGNVRKKQQSLRSAPGRREEDGAEQ